MSEFCGCGCGQRTPIASKTRGAIGHVKGQPTPYVNGHSAQLVEGRRPGGDQESWSRSQAVAAYPLGVECENGCGAPAVERHHKDGSPFNNAPENIMRVCRRCHMVVDGRLEQFKANRYVR